MLDLALYTTQVDGLPGSGRHILAQYDSETVIVYQAYRLPIAEWAVTHQQLGGPEFGLSRMSWIKPNFLWMMYRSGWATKPGQDRVLALRVSRSFFDELLRLAVPSSFSPRLYASQAAWREALGHSTVRLQWDPDHDPYGARLERRAIQLGLRGEPLRRLCTAELLEVLDITPFVAAQRVHVETRSLAELQVPREAVYTPEVAEVAAALELDDVGE
jgi:hypothetical protein